MTTNVPARAPDRITAAYDAALRVADFACRQELGFEADRQALVDFFNEEKEVAAASAVLPSDEPLATIIAECARNMRNEPYEDFAIAVEGILARHRAPTR